MHRTGYEKAIPNPAATKKKPPTMNMNPIPLIVGTSANVKLSGLIPRLSL